MNSIELTIWIIIAIGIFIFIISQKNLLNVYDWKQDYITTGLCARCKYFDKHSKRCFSGKHPRWIENKRKYIYWDNEPCDGKNSCIDFKNE